MRTLVIGIALILLSGSSFSLVYDTIKDKDQAWWFRLVQLVFAAILGLLSVFMASFLK